MKMIHKTFLQDNFLPDNLPCCSLSFIFLVVTVVDVVHDKLCLLIRSILMNSLSKMIASWYHVSWQMVLCAERREREKKLNALVNRRNFIKNPRASSSLSVKSLSLYNFDTGNTALPMASVKTGLAVLSCWAKENNYC